MIHKRVTTPSIRGGGYRCLIAKLESPQTQSLIVCENFLLLKSKRIFPQDDFADFFRLHINLLLFKMCFLRLCIDMLIYGFILKFSQAT